MSAYLSSPSFLVIFVVVVVLWCCLMFEWVIPVSALLLPLHHVSSSAIPNCVVGYIAYAGFMVWSHHSTLLEHE